MKRLLANVSIALLAAPLMYAQGQMMGDYLDVFMVKVRPEKRADFDTVNKKIADANRKAKGDFWLATQAEYGEVNTVQFLSQRQNYAAVESGMNAFMGAIKEAYGPGGMPKMMAEFNSTILSGRGEIRRRRWDLTANGPEDADAYNKIVGGARWIRTMQIRVRNGREDDFEEHVKEAKTALEKSSKLSYFVSQVVVGGPGSTYYVSTLLPSLAALDSAPKLAELMGKESYATWVKAVSEDEMTSETILMRVMPEMSNPPEGIVKVDPDFWRPKHMAAEARLAPKPALTAKAGQ